MHHPEAVGDESASRRDQFGQLPSQRESLGVVLAGLARVEADVLQQQHVAVGQPLGAGQRIGADDVAGQLHVPAELFAERARRPAPASSFGSGPPLGRPRCAATTTLAPAAPAPSASVPMR